MMRFIIPYLIYSVAALLCIFLQSEVFSYLQIFNAKPDLLFLLVMMSGLKTDWKNGFAAGIILGFWIDLLNGGYFGTNMVVYALIGVICGMVGKRFPDRTYEGYFFSAVVASLFAGFLDLIVFLIVGVSLPVWQTIIGTILPMTFYTSLIAFLCLPLVFLYRRQNRRKIGRIDLLGNGIIFVRGNEKVDMTKIARQRAVAAKEKRARLDRERRQAYEHRKKQQSNSGKVRRGAGQESDRSEQQTAKSGRSAAQQKSLSYLRHKPNQQSGRRRK